MTTTVERPARVFSFSDWSRRNPSAPPPGDRLDSQFSELINAIETTQAALADIRRDDGALRNGMVGPLQMQPGLLDSVTATFMQRTSEVRQSVETAYVNAMAIETNISMFAQDAERAAAVAQQMLNGVTAIRQAIEHIAMDVGARITAFDTEATDAENWANYSKAQADNAIAAKDEALQWAEYLAGPVVSAANAPDFIEASKFPNGLFYQPVQGYGGLGGLWSAKWWAIRAQQLVGNLSVYYLGAWDHPPLPGEINADTGESVPNPLKQGSFYFDTNTGQMMVFDGFGWSAPFALTAGVLTRFFYTATAGQTGFSGPDDNGATPVVGAAASAVHVNGVKLVPDDYAISGDMLTIIDPLPAGAIVEWDLLASPAMLAPGSVVAYKLTLTPAPDGVTTNFTATYVDPVSLLDTPAAIGTGAQVTASIDGIVQEPGIDFSASGNNIHFTEAPTADAHLWAVWMKPGAEA